MVPQNTAKHKTHPQLGGDDAQGAAVTCVGPYFQTRVLSLTDEKRFFQNPEQAAGLHPESSQVGRDLRLPG